MHIIEYIECIVQGLGDIVTGWSFIERPRVDLAMTAVS